MKILIKTAVTTAILALVAVPAMAHVPQTPSDHGRQHVTKTKTPGPHASFPSKAKAYGKYCQSFSKKHIAGTPGTPFSRCVNAMARLGSGRTDSPHMACRALSKKHVAGQKGTPFSRCVSAGAKLLKDQESDDETTSEDETTS
jgi:hypothetical protein